VVTGGSEVSRLPPTKLSQIPMDEDLRSILLKHGGHRNATTGELLPGVPDSAFPRNGVVAMDAARVELRRCSILNMTYNGVAYAPRPCAARGARHAGRAAARVSSAGEGQVLGQLERAGRGLPDPRRWDGRRLPRGPHRGAPRAPRAPRARAPPAQGLTRARVAARGQVTVRDSSFADNFVIFSVWGPPPRQPHPRRGRSTCGAG
jgi:hypothetical protein